MLDFIFNRRKANIRFEDITAPEFAILELISVDKLHAKKYFELYRKFVANSNGSLTSTAFLHFFDVDRSFVTNRIFNMTTTKANDEISFVKFVYTIWYSCQLTFEDLYQISFTTFDINNRNHLEIDDLPQLLGSLYGDSRNPGHNNWTRIKAAKKLYQELFNACVDKGGVLEYNEFRRIMLNHGTAMVPVFHLQRKIRSKAFGEKFWDKLQHQPIKAKHFTREDVLDMIRNHSPNEVVSMINNTGGARSYMDFQEKAVTMSVSDDITRRDLYGQPLPPRKRPSLFRSMSANRVQFVGGNNADERRLNIANKKLERQRAEFKPLTAHQKPSRIQSKPLQRSATADTAIERWEQSLLQRIENEAIMLDADKKDETSADDIDICLDPREAYGNKVDLFLNNRYNHKKIMPVRSSPPKCSTTECGWDYLADDEDRPRVKKTIDSAAIMPKEEPSEKFVVEKVIPKEMHGTLGVTEMEGFDLEELATLQKQYGHSKKKPQRKNINMAEYMASLPDQNLDLYGDVTFRPRIKHKMRPLTQRVITEICDITESTRRNNPYEVVSAPNSGYMDEADYREFLNMKKQSSKYKVKIRTFADFLKYKGYENIANDTISSSDTCQKHGVEADLCGTAKVEGTQILESDEMNECNTHHSLSNVEHIGFRDTTENEDLPYDKHEKKDNSHQVKSCKKYRLKDGHLAGSNKTGDRNRNRHRLKAKASEGSNRHLKVRYNKSKL